MVDPVFYSGNVVTIKYFSEIFCLRMQVQENHVKMQHNVNFLLRNPKLDHDQIKRTIKRSIEQNSIEK